MKVFFSLITYPSFSAIINIQIFDIEHLDYITGPLLTLLSLLRMLIQSTHKSHKFLFKFEISG